MKRVGGYVLAAMALTLGLGTAGSYWYYYDAIHISEQSFAERQQLLEPHIQVFLPEASEPRPALILFHGCGGLSEAMPDRVQAANARDYVAIVVDSHTPRDINWRDNCAGRVLQGAERAGDLLVALDFARHHPAVDPDQLFIVGYSHGAWTALEALALDERLPPGLVDSPGGHLQGLRGIVAWYPYCGFGVEFADGWEQDVPVIMLLAENDRRTPKEDCLLVVQDQQAAGRRVHSISYPRVGHSFDVDSDWVDLYDPEIHQQALMAQFSFIEQLLP